MPVQFFIAFYRTGVPRKYHWVLLASDNGIPSSTEPVKCYEIMQERILDSIGAQLSIKAVWERQDGKRTRLSDNTSSFLGLLAFPPSTDVDLTLSSVYDVFDNIPAVPHSRRSEEWTCAKWIVDILLEYGPI